MKNEKKTLIIGLIVGIIVTLFYSHFFAPRYEIRKDGMSMIKLDKWTGQSWTLVNNDWKRMVNLDENWEEIDKALAEAMKIPFAQVDSESALRKLKAANPILKNISDDELVERIKLVYSKMVLVNMYLGEFVKSGEQAPSEGAGAGK